MQGGYPQSAATSATQDSSNNLLQNAYNNGSGIGIRPFFDTHAANVVLQPQRSADGAPPMPHGVSLRQDSAGPIPNSVSQEQIAAAKRALFPSQSGRESGGNWLTEARRDRNAMDHYERHISRRRFGVVIASEFSGISRMLTGCLRVNPWALRDISDAMDGAMSMHAAERFERFTKDFTYTRLLTLTDWFSDFIDDIRSDET